MHQNHTGDLLDVWLGRIRVCDAVGSGLSTPSPPRCLHFSKSPRWCRCCYLEATCWRCLSSCLLLWTLHERVSPAIHCFCFLIPSVRLWQWFSNLGSKAPRWFCHKKFEKRQSIRSACCKGLELTTPQVWPSLFAGGGSDSREAAADWPSLFFIPTLGRWSLVSLVWSYNPSATIKVYTSPQRLWIKKPGLWAAVRITPQTRFLKSRLLGPVATASPGNVIEIPAFELLLRLRNPNVRVGGNLCFNKPRVGSCCGLRLPVAAREETHRKLRDLIWYSVSPPATYEGLVARLIKYLKTI